MSTVAELPAVLRGENEYLRRAVEEGAMESDVDRKQFVREYSWAIPNDAALDAITALSPIIEVGAGGGYWAKLLRERGAIVGAYDLHAPGPENESAKRRWSEVETTDALPSLLYMNVTLLLCWPSKNEVWPEVVLGAYCGNTVVYIGEGEGGCCATPGFFALLERDFECEREIDIPRWHGVRDSLTIWRR